MDSPKILIVDDEETGLRVRQLVLEAEGFRVLAAKNGSEALEIVAREMPDAVITDHLMPGMDGVQVAREIKRKHSQIPIVMLSALQNQPDGAAEVTDAFVVKGQAPAVLLDTIASLLRTDTHSHAEFQGKYVVFVDENRRYIEMTDGVCELVGYTREELLQMKIDDLAAPSQTKHVAPLFERYVKDKGMDGTFELKNKSGNLVPIRYHSRVFPDGCMVASWEPQL